MGVTIHFGGALRGSADYASVVLKAREFSARQGWNCEDLVEARRTLKRVRDEQDWNYTGFTKGLVIKPHPDAEPVRLEFDDGLHVQDYCKTQFAGPTTHIAIIELLRLIQPHFDKLSVDDEGEFWESGDAALLSEHIQNINRAIANLVAEKPSREVAVRLPSSRIVDVIG